MANAIRTKTDILSILADNATRDIGEQDLRDSVLSLMGQMGQLSNQGNAVATSIALVNTWYDANLAGAVLSEVTQTLGVDDFDMPVAGQLRYLGIPTRHFHCVATVSFTAASNNQEIHFRFGKNGTHSPQAEVRRKVGTGADIGALAVHWITSLSQNDYLCLMVQNISSAANITIVSSNIQTVGMMM